MPLARERADRVMPSTVSRDRTVTCTADQSPSAGSSFADTAGYLHSVHLAYFSGEEQAPNRLGTARAAATGSSEPWPASLGGQADPPMGSKESGRPTPGESRG
jgi:hypothetical protein